MYKTCALPQSVLNNTLLQAAQCDGGANTSFPFEYPGCILCPNTDLAGVGNRAAFYAQSLFNTLLVIFSPDDAVPSAWASALLTTALVVAAVVQKIQNTITLHHAVLVLNYATLSCISSIAIAPILPIWRLKPGEFYARELERHRSPSPRRLRHAIAVNSYKHKIKEGQNKQRVILTLSLFIQVALQWAWGIVMFVAPSYSQPDCNKTTILLFFFVPMTVEEINHGKFWFWVLWLLFCLGLTLTLIVVLAISGRERAYKGLSRVATQSTINSPIRTPVYKQFRDAVMALFPPLNDRRRQIVFWGNVIAVFLWVMYIVQSELQNEVNCIFPGENDFGGFGQISAALLALTPIWILCEALYRLPSELHKAKRLRQQAQEARSRSLSSSRRSPVPPRPGNALDITIQSPVSVHSQGAFLQSRSVAAPSSSRHSSPSRPGSIRVITEGRGHPSVPREWIELRPVAPTLSL